MYSETKAIEHERQGARETDSMRDGEHVLTMSMQDGDNDIKLA